MIEIPLHDRFGDVVAYALVDDEDADVASLRWSRQPAPNTTYAARWAPRETVTMHRMILGLAKGDPRVADHINRNGLDNRRANLRIVTRAENAQNASRRRDNKSGYRGVNYIPRRRSWRAAVVANGHLVVRHGFATAEEAGAAARQLRAALLPLATD